MQAAGTSVEDPLREWIQAFVPDVAMPLPPEEVLIQILDQCGAAALLLNTEFQCLATTRQARTLIESNAIFELRSTRLFCRLTPIEFRRAFLAATERRRVELLLDAPGQRGSWHLVLTPVPAADDKPRILIFVVEESTGQRCIAPEKIRALLGLTPGESELVAALTNGCSTRDYAADRQLSIHTVRNQLKSVYLKLDIHSQKDLAAHVIRRCMLGQPSPL